MPLLCRLRVRMAIMFHLWLLLLLSLFGGVRVLLLWLQGEPIPKLVLHTLLLHAAFMLPSLWESSQGWLQSQIVSAMHRSNVRVWEHLVRVSNLATLVISIYTTFQSTCFQNQYRVHTTLLLIIVRAIKTMANPYHNKTNALKEKMQE